MKREEKNLQSRQKIITAALQEFSEKSYAEASLNTICGDGGISKGIIYHYFKDKDELFLVCVQECFDALTDYLKGAIVIGGTDLEADLQTYFHARIEFFEQNPLYLKLFCNAGIMPPQHLESAIAEIRKEFDTLNISVLTKLIANVKLRDGITIEEVVNLFRFYQDFVNARYRLHGTNRLDIKEHEEKYSHALNVMLYGVVEREKQTQ